MRIVRGHASYPPDARGAAVALGVFDGIHLGHRVLLATAVARARTAGLDGVACTFDRHPLETLTPGRAPLPIATLDERLALIAATGIDTTVVLQFDRALASMEPEAFVKDVLVERLRAREIVVGFNHRFGRGARGDAALLADLAHPLGFLPHVVPPLAIDGVTVSSSEVRAALGRGDVERAARFLGRPYDLPGTVVRGAERGRTLGFPTANLAPDRPVLVPPGVYACRLDAGEGERGAVTNVGVRPTFGESAIAVEAHVLDFAGDLYGRHVRLLFVARIRDERRFPSVDALREQIARDVEAARTRL